MNNKLLKVLVVGLVMCGITTDASAESLTVEKLEAMCAGLSSAGVINGNQGACILYVNGFVDGYYANAWALDYDPLCVPAGVTNLQMARVFLKWAGDNPNQGHAAAGTGFLNALVAAYPCPPPPKA
ncbi:MAG: hypothetical protein K0M70_02965 [Arenimonas sp.]|uniref:Rap1a/Tai family immunity protein n=1 Tax=Arenimonas sp. TaxID=1872635 RepID=UPI0025B80750|nr:Rap1a/Tai family immunity protein [Arenimonas sp.]MBW8366803.1 hypothetical protein [Arenimonas sp.]